MNNDFIDFLPGMKTGDDLISALTVLPNYSDGIRLQSKSIRLVALSDLYKIYLSGL